MRKKSLLKGGIAIALSLAMVMGTPGVALADDANITVDSSGDPVNIYLDRDGGNAGTNSLGSTTVTMNVKSSFIVTVPKQISFTTESPAEGTGVIEETADASGKVSWQGVDANVTLPIKGSIKYNIDPTQELELKLPDNQSYSVSSTNDKTGNVFVYSNGGSNTGSSAKKHGLRAVFKASSDSDLSGNSLNSICNYTGSGQSIKVSGANCYLQGMQETQYYGTITTNEAIHAGNWVGPIAFTVSITGAGNAT